jgi:multiple sugar transport system permease protein
MKRKRGLIKLVIHTVLLVGSVTFLFPLLWMISTSLKPIEQTMVMPPQWVPRAYHAVVDGERIQVKKLFQLDEPSVIVRATAGERKGEKLLVPAKDFSDGQAAIDVRVADRVERIKVPADVIKEASRGWWYVVQTFKEQYGHPQPKWDCLPEEEIESRAHPYFNNYREALGYIPFFTYAKNTLVVCVLGVIGAVVSSSVVAYGFSRIEWKGRDLFFILTLATMMIPFPVTMIPLFATFRRLHWIGTLKPLWVPPFFGHAFNIFLLRQFYLTIPRDLSDAARIDGCSEFAIFRRVVVPLSVKALAVVALFHFIYAWNDFMGPLLYLTRQETFTLSLGLQFYQSQQGGSEWHYLMAASTLVVVPIVILFFFTQKTFIQGIATTGTKE